LISPTTPNFLTLPPILIPPPPKSTLFPYTTLFRSPIDIGAEEKYRCKDRIERRPYRSAQVMHNTRDPLIYAEIRKRQHAHYYDHRERVHHLYFDRVTQSIHRPEKHHCPEQSSRP